MPITAEPAFVEAEALLGALGLERGGCVALIGGGGKTTLVERLSRTAKGGGARVLMTTTTKIGAPPIPAATDALVRADVGGLRAQLRAASAIGALRWTWVAGGDGHKLIGVTPAEVDTAWRERLCDLLLVEADGSRGRSFKAHAPYEPPIPESATHVIAVVGVDVLGHAVEGERVHRPERVAALLGRAPGFPLEAEHVAAVLLHPQGWFAAAPEAAVRHVVLNKVEGPVAEESAEAIARALRQRDRDGRLGRVLAVSLAPPAAEPPADASGSEGATSR